MRKVLIGLGCLIVAPLLFGTTFVVLADVKLYEPNSIGFAYDVNAVNYKLLGGAELVVDQQFVCDVNYYDPDGDRVEPSLLAELAGFSFSDVNDSYEWQMRWTPTNEQVGLFYIDFQIEDRPDYGIPLTDEGTLIIKVHEVNQKPVLKPICGG